MGYGILRLEKRSTTQSVRAMVRHALREDVPTNAVEGAPKPKLASGTPTSWDDASAKLQAARARHTASFGTMNKNTVQCLDLLVTTSAAEGQSWSVEKQNQYFKEALTFLADRFGGRQNILAAAIHRDESTPHMQVLIMPIDSAGRFSGAKMIGGPSGLSEMQDAFHEKVSPRHGLERGAKRTGAKHVPVRALYAAMAAGVQSPEFLPLPEPLPIPAPATMMQRMQGMKPAIDAERARIDGLNKAAKQAAIDKNNAARATLNAQAEAGRKLSPKLIERGAAQYRAGRSMQELAKTAQAQAEAQKKAAEATLSQAKAISKLASENAAAKMSEAEQKISRAAHTEEESAKILDKFSKDMAKEFVGTLSQALGIELVHGKGLLDQVRRAGRASTMVEAAKVLEQASDGLTQTAERWQDRQQTSRPRG